MNDAEKDKIKFNKDRNPVTGDRIVSKENGRSKYEENFDKIKWGVREQETKK